VCAFSRSKQCSWFSVRSIHFSVYWLRFHFRSLAHLFLLAPGATQCSRSPLSAPVGLVHLPRQVRTSLDPNFCSGTPLVCVSQRVPWFCSPARVSLTRRARHSISLVLVCSHELSPVEHVTRFPQCWFAHAGARIGWPDLISAFLVSSRFRSSILDRVSFAIF
jgi:hypothetical protein